MAVKVSIGTYSKITLTERFFMAECTGTAALMSNKKIRLI